MSKLTLIYFSPTGTTKASLEAIAGGFNAAETVVLDMTLPEARKQVHKFNKDDAVVIGLPSYSGRVPAPAEDIFKNIEGNGAACALVVTYGNRDYEDALLELKNNAEERGFKPIAAAGVVCEHSFSKNIATGRPNNDDKAKLNEFGKTFAEKIKAENFEAISVKGNYPYRELSEIPFVPTSNDKCVKCGICADSCPEAAIPKSEPEKTYGNKCIVCCRCIRICPHSARYFNHPSFEMVVKNIESKCAERKEPEFIV